MLDSPRTSNRREIKSANISSDEKPTAASKLSATFSKHTKWKSATQSAPFGSDVRSG